MTQSNSLLGRKKFPVRARREFPNTVFKLLSYLAQFRGPRGSNPTKFPVFSQLAGNLEADGWARGFSLGWEKIAHIVR